MEKATIFVRGRVQGVGFRWWARSQAVALGLVGYARNLDDGRVEICAEGPRDALDRLAALVGESPSSTRRPGRVESTVVQWGSASGTLRGFAER